MRQQEADFTPPAFQLRGTQLSLIFQQILMVLLTEEVFEKVFHDKTKISRRSNSSTVPTKFSFCKNGLRRRQ